MKISDRISDAMLDLYEIQKAQIRRLGNKVERLENYIERLEMTIEGHEQYRCDADQCIEKQRKQIEKLIRVAEAASLLKNYYPVMAEVFEISDALVELEADDWELQGGGE